MSNLLPLSVILGSLNIVGNLSLIVALCKTKLDRESNRFIFLFDLSLGGLIVGLADITREIVFALHLESNHDDICRANITFIIAGVAQACFGLLAYVFDQFLYIAHPLHYHTWMTRRNCVIIVVMSKVVSVLHVTVTTVEWNWGIPCSYFHNVPKWHHFTTFLLIFAFPLSIIIALQGHTILLALKHTRQIRDSRVVSLNRSDQQLTHKAGLRKVVTTTLILVCLGVSWLPMAAMFLWAALVDDVEGRFFQALDPIGLLYYSYGFWIPFIYAIRSPSLRTALKKKKLFSCNRWKW